MAFDIVRVGPENVDTVGFFCYMSKRKTIGYARKLSWVKARLSEGMQILMCTKGGRGFIEYIPGEYAWRAVEARDYMVIHCIWNVGKSRGSGLSQELLRMCEIDAKKLGMQGVVMVTSEGNWLIHRKFLLGQGYQLVDKAPQSFSLLVKKFGSAPDPGFCGDWEHKQQAFGKGLTLVRTDQCPYLEAVATNTRKAALELGITFHDITLQTAAEIREKAPCPYGTNAILLNGKFLSNTWISGKELRKRISIK